MAGDKFNIRVSSWYKTNGNQPGTPINPLTDLLTALTSSFNGIGGAHGATGTEIYNTGVFTTNAQSFLNDQVYNSSKPKAFVNWLLLDEQFKYVNSSSGAEQVGNDQALTTHVKTDLPVNKSGYLYIYVSNETPNIDVFFDNLQVTHTRGAILEETHYYPFGLTMAGISSKAEGIQINRSKFNYGRELQSQEFSDGSGLEMYDTKFRALDPQLGRWWQRDPLAEFHYGISPYSYVLNNPLSYNDPLGLDTVPINGAGAHKVKVRKGDVLKWTIGETTSYYTYDPTNKDAVNGFVAGGIDQGVSEPVTVSKSTNAESSNSYSWAPLAGLINNSLNTTAGYFENLSTIRTTVGYGFKSPWYKLKLYPSGWAGNQYVKTLTSSKIGKLGGVITFGVGTVIDAYGVYTYYTQGSENPNAVHPAKAGINLGVGIYGLYGGPPGWIFGTCYFLIDATIGWPAAIQSYIEVEKNKADMRKLNLMTFSDFKY